MRSAPSNSDDVIDSRDVIKRIEELDSERQDLIDAVEAAVEALNDARQARAAAMADADGDRESAERADEAAYDAEVALKDAKAALLEWTGNLDDVAGVEVIEPSDEARELAELESLQEQCDGYFSDWTRGATLIADSYFEEYARELASDIGAIQRDVGWPCDCIDWAQAAGELKMDYTEVDFGGVSYQIR